MSRMMTLRKKGLAVMLGLMMAACTMSGCGKEPAQAETEEKTEEEDENALEVPEVKGKEEEVGVFTLLVPKGMEAETTVSDSEIMLLDEDLNALILQVTEKDDAKKLVEYTMDGDESYKEIEFSLDGTTWKGCSYKKKFVIWAKIGKKIVVVTGEGFKYTDDIPLAVLASIQVDPDADTVNLGGGTAVSNGGEFVYGAGIYSVHYGPGLRETEGSEEGDLVSLDGSQTIYVSGFGGWALIDDEMYSIEENCDYQVETIYSNGMPGYLYTYEGYDGRYVAEYILPLDYIYSNTAAELMGVFICSYAPDMDTLLSDEFMGVIDSIALNGECFTGETRYSQAEYASDAVRDYWQRGWYGWWIYADASPAYTDLVTYSYDCLATFDFEPGFDGTEIVHFQLVDTDGDLDMDVEMSWYSDGTLSGWLVGDRGNILGSELGQTWINVDPESTMFILQDYLFFDTYVYDEDYEWVEIRVVLRPWGSDFSDFCDLDEDDLPFIYRRDGEEVRASYGDMFPFNYDTWYVGIMDDPFPGLYAIEGTALQTN